jgi:diadenosine tetraphosphatase ApaH/serine/threonine PP2A family protein phosphatase
MRYAIFSDIHANIIAFQAVLADIERRGGVDEFWCLGDIVGYGPDPHECIELLWGYPHIAVAGNHDLGAVDKTTLANFNPDGVAALRWTKRHLQTTDRDYLSRLPATLVKDKFTLVHGSPRQPTWEYLLSTGLARENFGHFQTPFCLVGHTHLPALFKNEAGIASAPKWQEGIGRLLDKGQLIINPGSVGQPRDGDPRASYAFYDSETGILRLHRVVYDIKEAQLRFLKAGLPVRLATRLEKGS